MANNTPFIIGLIILFCAITSCQKEPDSPPQESRVLNLPETPFDYGDSNYPLHLKDALVIHDNTPSDNAITNEGATLGRVLFYDKKLSLNETVSCASCHHQDKAFTDGVSKSEGFQGERTKRNTMSLLNLRMYDRKKMFWDERAENLERQIIHPIQDPVEMGMQMPLLIDRLRKASYYSDLCESAFGERDMRPEFIFKALSQFMRSMVTYESKYDHVLQGSDNFSPEELAGQTLYNTVGTQQGCVSCHGGDIIDAHSYNFQIGQRPSTSGVHDFSDLGMYEFTHNPQDSSRFKVSSLRNIELTAPYLHDGSIPDLKTLFGPGSHHNFGMSDDKIADLIAFLKTLTDEVIISDEKFSDPFVK